MFKHMLHGHWIRDDASIFKITKLDLHAMYGEFLGTVVFLMIGMAGVQATVTDLSINQNGNGNGTAINGSDAARLMGLFYISSAFGISLYATANIFYRFTGSIFNPSVTLALMLSGAITPGRMVVTAIAQLVGGIVAAALLDALTPGELSVSCQLGFGTTRTQGLFIEMFCTAALVISVLMLAAEKSKLTPTAPLGFGFMLWAVELFSVGIHRRSCQHGAGVRGFSSYHWIYWVGPTLGSLLATAFYFLLKFIKYWEINPGQDSEHAKDSPLSNLPNDPQSRGDSHSMA
ncbi:hypothetical protein NCC49_000886 [Naganishia albida]|nr:hypothetical protein NCC49_000886 [Naganishia albida]